MFRSRGWYCLPLTDWLMVGTECRSNKKEKDGDGQQRSEAKLYNLRRRIVYEGLGPAQCDLDVMSK